MPTAETLTKNERAVMKKALEAYRKENEEISDAIEVMRQTDSVRNRGRYLIESDPYRSIPGE